MSWVGWAGMLYMAFFASFLSYTLFAWLLQYLEASRIAAVSYLQVPVVIVLAVTFLGEHPSAHLISGAALVLAGVYLTERARASSTTRART